MATDPHDLRGDAPLLDAWLRFQESAPTPFTIPGHKQRHDLVGDVVAGDVPLYAGLDTMRLAFGVLADAESRAARLWGADWCRFSVGGSTHGNQALALALATGPAEGVREVVVSRTLHRSMLLGLVLSGLTPIWVRPEIEPQTCLPAGVAAETVGRALDSHPGACGVLVGEPSYVGTVGDVGALAQVTRARGVPLVVDAAWAPHFGFHPDLPAHALALGADAMVISAHKSLPAWSQASIVLARTTGPTGLDPARLDAAFEATATTSPAGAILASTDAARALLERRGEALFDEALAGVRGLRDRLSAVDGLLVLDGPGVDPLKVTLVLSGTGARGLDLEADLMARGLPVEMADRDTIVAQVSLADTRASLDALASALVESIDRHRGRPRPIVAGLSYTVNPVMAMTPREAFFAPQELVPRDRAVGRVCAELIAPYPPGIPVLAPGEEVTRSALDALLEAQAAGLRIAYAADPELTQLRVVV